VPVRICISGSGFNGIENPPTKRWIGIFRKIYTKKAIIKHPNTSPKLNLILACVE
jgi:hypothetical protein